MQFTKRLHAALLIAGLSGLSLPGCATSLLDAGMLKAAALKPSLMDGHLAENRALTQFTDSLNEDNEKAFRRCVSTRFEQRAMRSPDAWKDLEIVKLPKTKLELEDSTAVDENTFETIAKDEKGTRYQFKIVRDPQKRTWVVDDILLRQKKKGTRSTKSAADVMDLLLTVREFTDTWQSRDRSAILQSASSSLREPLEALPEAWLDRLVERIASECEAGMARRPEVQMNDSDAVVKMPAKNGFFLMKVLREDDQWLFSDVEVRQRKTDDHPGSILRQARALNAVSQFFDAYAKEDKDALKLLSDEQFFRTSLEIGDLSMIPMPSSEHAPDDFEIRSFSGQLTIMVPDKTQIVQLDLTTPQSKDRKASQQTVEGTVETSFVVRDITIYDRQTRKQQKLESAFTAPARAMLFVASLHDQNLPILKQLSTAEFSEGTWNRIDPGLVSYLSLSQVPGGVLTLRNTDVRGDTTEMEFMSDSGRICSIIMRSENGTLNVDDVQYPNSVAQVASLKNHLQLTVPIVELAAAWQKQDMSGVKRTCSMDFNRLIWSNLKSLPAEFDRLPNMLLVPVESMTQTDAQAVVELVNEEQQPVSVRLLKENRAWVVDEIAIRGPNGVVCNVRQDLRREIAQRFLDNPDGGIMQAVGERAADGSSGVVHAGGISEQPRRGNLTLPSGARTASRTAMLPPGIDMTPTPARSTTSSSDGIMQFGPGSQNTTPTAAAKPAAQKPHLKNPASTEEHDGVVYFNGAPAMADDKSELTDPVQAVNPLGDFSKHPIEIPGERTPH
ncbi:MAG TPA: hypothetical protein PLY87_09690 [Planctomycetaceae bacterium]|nr:hypothetical protein [Planctomycetaceae bacterium]HQZ65338.1 hypothetical protein [Planctomycetaceae bacterium]HRA87273.1 hypothetical protein [Planctomycetaceae bacterium]